LSEVRVLLVVAGLSVGMSMLLFGARLEVFAVPAVAWIVLPVVQVGVPVLMWVVAEVKGRGRSVEVED